ncbi:hypothetical protein, partial [Dactylosporangium matsuzakiense]
AKLERWGDGETGVFAAHEAVGSFYAALIDRFPPLETFNDDDIDRLGVWSVTPERSEAIVVASCVWSRADEVGAAVMALVAAHGLVCYEPGYHIVNPNALGYLAPFTLTSERFPAVPEPDDRRLEWMMSKVGRDNGYAILKRADGWFVQVGYGMFAGVANGTYALEYQEGSLDRHFRCETPDRTAAVRLLQEFRVGDDAWKQRHLWRPVHLDSE